MTSPWMIPAGRSSAAAAPTAYQIARSLRFRAAAGGYLSRTFGVAGSNQKLTYSTWVKRSGFGVMDFLSSAIASLDSFRFTVNDQIQVYLGNGDANLTSASVYRDPGAFMHVVLAIDTTQPTPANRVRVYVNGVEITAWGTNTPPAPNYPIKDFNKAQAHSIGRYAPAVLDQFDGYFADTYFIDGQQLTPGAFGAVDATTGAWVPVAYTGTYGANGFHLDFADNSNVTAATLGKDTSGNGNNWTPNSFSVTAGVTNDSLVDTPTNYGTDTGAGGEVRGNYTTLNPLANEPNVANAGSVALSEGNLKVTFPNSVWAAEVHATQWIRSGKWYWEMTPVTGIVSAEYPNGGISTNAIPSPNGYNIAGAYLYRPSGNKSVGATGSAYGAAFTTNDVIGFALDADAGSLTCYKNGASQGVLASGLTGPYVPDLNGYNGAAAVFNAGQRPFGFAAPAGYKALCTANFPDPAIKKPSQYFDVALYVGNGGANAVTGMGFQPDIDWIKRRSGSENHNLTDSVRGPTITLYPNLPNAAVADTAVTAFTADGFTLNGGGNGNVNGQTFAAWLWKKGVVPGLDIVAYAGTGVARTVAHALGVPPSLMLIKDRSSAVNWAVYHKSLGNTLFMELNTSAGQTVNAGYWNNTDPTSSVFSVGASSPVNANGDNFIAYLFAEVPGFSKFGAYVGNASTDGPFVWCGFRPRWIMAKRFDVANDWPVVDVARDPYNQQTHEIYADLPQAETSSGTFDILSNGFKARNAQAFCNAGGGSYIFAAFAENPFKYARAR